MNNTIKQFNPKELELPFSMLILGKSKSGKTKMVHHIINAIKKDISEIYLFSMTSFVNRKEFFYIPEENLITHLDLELIESILESQKEAKEPKNILFLLDDIIGDNAIKSPTIRNLFTLGRHYKISIIFLSQTYKQNAGLPTIIRENTNWIISFFQQNYKQRKSFCEEYLSIKSIKEGEEIYKHITATPYQAVVINCLNTSARDYDNYLMKYKIDIKEKLKPFLIKNKNKLLEKKKQVGFHFRII